jgi:hypothetical protein
MWWPDDDTSIFLSRHIEDNIYVKILMRKGLPPEIACKIVLPLVLLKRHYVLPHQFPQEKRSRLPLYKRLSNQPFCAQPFVALYGRHARCICITPYSGGGFILHHPKCTASEDWPYVDPGPKPYVDPRPGNVDYGRLGCAVCESPQCKWELYYDYNEQSKGETWLAERNERLRKMSKYLFRWDRETVKAQAMRIEYKGNVEASLAAWKAMNSKE